MKELTREERERIAAALIALEIAFEEHIDMAPLGVAIAELQQAYRGPSRAYVDSVSSIKDRGNFGRWLRQLRVYLSEEIPDLPAHQISDDQTS
jgi:hypothetical protein